MKTFLGLLSHPLKSVLHVLEEKGISSMSAKRMGTDPYLSHSPHTELMKVCSCSTSHLREVQSLSDSSSSKVTSHPIFYQLSCK